MSDQSSTEKVIPNILFILDESGSMEDMGVEPVQAVNKFIDDQKVAMGDDGATFSLWKFNSTVVKVIDDVPLKDVKEFSDFEPKNMTALYDAIGHAIDTKKKKNSFDNVVCIILTDGLENSSTEYSAATIRSMIKDMEENHNWKFVYLGANQDAFAVGGAMGVVNCAQYECEMGEMIGITRDVSDAVSSYRAHSSNIGRKAALTLPERPIQTSDACSARRQMSSPY
jgi:hypothetical protein